MNGGVFNKLIKSGFLYDSEANAISMPNRESKKICLKSNIGYIANKDIFFVSSLRLTIYHMYALGKHLILIILYLILNIYMTYRVYHPISIIHMPYPKKIIDTILY